MIDAAALDRAVRRCRLMLHLCRKLGIDDTRSLVQQMTPLIVSYYRQELARERD